MRMKKLTALILAAVLLSMSPGVYGAQDQGGVPTDAEIEQIRKNIEAAEHEQPPPMYAEQHRRDTAALRLKLRDKLQAQRAAMASYLERVRTLFPDRVAQIEQDIRAKDGEIKAAADALLSSVSGQRTPPTNRPPSSLDRGDTSTGTDTNANLSANVVAGPGAGGPAAVAPPVAGPPVQLGPGGQAGAAGGGEPPLPTAALLPPPAERASGALAEAEGAQQQNLLSPCGQVSVNSNHSVYEKAICTLAGEVQSRKRGANQRATITIGQNFFELQEIMAARLIGREERGKFLVEAEEARTDKQTGSGPLNAGSTSLVIKGGAPTVFGFAVENGALVQSQSGTTVTFRGNPIGLFKLLNGKTFDESYLEDENDSATRLLKRTSFALSFDTNRGREPGVFTADAQQLSSYSLRYEFVNERDPRHPKHDRAFKDFLAAQGNNLALAVNDTFKSLIEDVGGAGGVPLKGNRFKDPVLQAWYEETRAAVAAAAPTQVEATIKTQLDKFPTVDKLEAATRNTVERFTEGFAGYLEAREKLLKEVAKGRVITFEFTNKREINAPDLSNFNFIAETGIFGGKADLTGNASFSFYNSRPQGDVQRVRDFRFAAQLDAPVKLRDLGSFVFSFAGKYERVLDDAIALDGTVLPGTKGDIGVGQFKLTLPFLEGTGVRFPISVTFANRTELVREKEVRGNFGFTLDLDKIFASLRPF